MDNAKPQIYDVGDLIKVGIVSISHANEVKFLRLCENYVSIALFRSSGSTETVKLVLPVSWYIFYFDQTKCNKL